MVLAYLLAISTRILSMGRLGDMMTMQPVYQTGFVIFTLGSVLCGLAPSVHWLIAFRVLQALGASMTMALGVAIITEAFPPQERGRALGIGGAIVSVGVVIGPTLGGLILGVLSWRWIFFVNLPVGILGVAMARKFVPNFRPKGKQQFDFWGAGTLCISLLALLLALTWGQRAGFTDRRVVFLAGLWLLFLLAFLRIEWTVPQPMIDLRMFRNLLFSVNLATGFITFVAMAGTIILAPFYLENILGFPPRQVGLIMAVVPLAMGGVAPFSGALSDRVGVRPIAVVGLALLVTGYLSLTTLRVDTSVTGYILRSLPIGLGMGVFQSPNNSAIMGAAPRERLGVASGLLAITRTLGQVTGISVLGAVWAGRVMAHYGRLLTGGATAAPPADQVSGLHDTFLLAAGLVAVGLLLSLWGLLTERRLRRSAVMGHSTLEG
ncbi:MAG: DHA2 family efflux MFS transporter permease subunit [Chloroflexi bacterium]|nr:MAG: DHA2 family efflux MFS transporter permease subunit [Chloroflexota bacterium]